MLDLPMVENLGIAAGCLTTGAFLPQVLRTYITRSTQDISKGMFILMCLGIAMWIAYGVLAGSFSVVAANCVSLALTASILAMKIIFERRR